MIRAITGDPSEGRAAVSIEITNAHFLPDCNSTSIDTTPADTKWPMYKVAHCSPDYNKSVKATEMSICREGWLSKGLHSYIRQMMKSTEGSLRYITIGKETKMGGTHVYIRLP